MDKNQPLLLKNYRLETAESFSKVLLKKCPDICAIIAYGSSVRGDYLPNSDIDILCIVDEGANKPTWDEGTFRGMQIDLDSRSVATIDPAAIVEDPYQFGLFRNVHVLYERGHNISNLIGSIGRRYSRETHKRHHLSVISTSVVKNYHDFRRLRYVGDRPGIIRAFMFSLWCFSEYMLVFCDSSPGGLGCLNRLKMVHSDSYVEILQLQNGASVSVDDLKRIGEAVIKGISGLSWFDTQAIKAKWMFNHGFGYEAFHIVGILAGLRIKDGGLPTETVDCWHEMMHWTPESLRNAENVLAHMLTKYNIAV